MLPPIEQRLSEELSAHIEQVKAAIALLDKGATVPFIARYRKEATGGLDDIQLRTLDERLGYLRQLEERRSKILQSIDEQGKLTTQLRGAIESATSKQRLEDLYLPYKPKRRSKAQISIDAGLQPLAEALLGDPNLEPTTEAMQYLNDASKEAGFNDCKAVLDGARHILMENFAEDASLLGELRDWVHAHAVLCSQCIKGKEAEGIKFRDWFNFAEPWRSIPSHRILAILRGRKEGVLQVRLALDSDLSTENKATGNDNIAVSLLLNPCEQRIARRFGISNQARAADQWLAETTRWAWRIKIFPHLELEILGALRAQAEEAAIHVFARNLKDLLLSAPAGRHAVIGLDPGLRTGVKVAVVDRQGKLCETAIIYPHAPRNDWQGALASLAMLAEKYKIELIAIGNGTASRETDKLAQTLIRDYPQLKLAKMMVSEAGASVYSASEFASRELAQIEVSLRGAVSIARRLQDPLAELVKIDPKSIGVGQYQHDVSPTRLGKSLADVVEDCVNAVGVELNTASAPLLSSVSGLNMSLAENIVAWRDTNGAFPSREALKKVPRLGERAFEQAAGFLRISGGDNPLDASAVHPEAYPLVQKILDDLGKSHKGVNELIGNKTVIKGIDPQRYTDDRFGLPTVQDILLELEKPGRDPRPQFQAARFADGIDKISHLRVGMLLEGVVTNVANFGAFIDIGVHQDGLAHISQLANRFVKDPSEVVKTGDIVKVRVLEVDLQRNRIALSLRLDDTMPASVPSAEEKTTAVQSRSPATVATPQASAKSAMAEAFSRLKQG